ncbi:MAG: hypothetical protein BMS9Abin26_0803 [Gammaproteobacteria bacterium]|nr:MAG: hypothetical protein BMS9Abin26_0803 [Gammaproteobacteria bacterium]
MIYPKSERILSVFDFSERGENFNALTLNDGTVLLVSKTLIRCVPKGEHIYDDDREVADDCIVILNVTDEDEVDSRYGLEFIANHEVHIKDGLVLDLVMLTNGRLLVIDNESILMYESDDDFAAQHAPTDGILHVTEAALDEIPYAG